MFIIFRFVKSDKTKDQYEKLKKVLDTVTLSIGLLITTILSSIFNGFLTALSMGPEGWKTFGNVLIMFIGPFIMLVGFRQYLRVLEKREREKTELIAEKYDRMEKERDECKRELRSTKNNYNKKEYELDLKMKEMESLHSQAMDLQKTEFLIAEAQLKAIIQVKDNEIKMINDRLNLKCEQIKLLESELKLRTES